MSRLDLTGLTWETSGPPTETQLIAGGVMILHLVDADTGAESITIANTAGLGAFTQAGLVATAHAIVNQPPAEDDE